MRGRRPVLRGKAGDIVVAKTAMLLQCGLGHTWEGTHEVIHGGWQRGPGRRPSPVLHTIWTPATCPVCGHRPAGPQRPLAIVPEVK